MLNLRIQKLNLNLKPTLVFKNCSYLCAYHCVQLSYITQHRTGLIIFSYPPDNHHRSDAIFWRRDVRVRQRIVKLFLTKRERTTGEGRGRINPGNRGLRQGVHKSFNTRITCIYGNILQDTNRRESLNSGKRKEVRLTNVVLVDEMMWR